ncbi:hypothetical protein M752DRAFT_55083 [Aspergillus phoenicis ATCC 13157]|uniref:Uncharacterized protein n=1 Tax=Aspergillus phoenicis ATCC 13157 TaxID=1353007 RepID=A0A370PAY8_ASPPH|nr:hypothetical protein M752DRAFT_55083 [Aspergillus phoenicis ATCC 13157]
MAWHIRAHETKQINLLTLTFLILFRNSIWRSGNFNSGDSGRHALFFVAAKGTMMQKRWNGFTGLLACLLAYVFPMQDRVC